MNNQRAYFDESTHRYRQEDAVQTPLAQRFEMEHLQRTLTMRPGMKLLDFGAGSGRVSFWFLKQGYDITAMDISQNSLLALQGVYTTHKKSSWGRLTTTTSLPNTKFDAIIGADILHHVDIHHFLPKLFDLLKPDGRIAFSEPNAWFFPWYIYILVRRLPWNIERGIIQMSVGTIDAALCAAGFNDVTISGFPFFRQFAFRLIVSAQKRAPRLHPSTLYRP